MQQYYGKSTAQRRGVKYETLNLCYTVCHSNTYISCIACYIISEHRVTQYKQLLYHMYLFGSYLMVDGEFIIVVQVRGTYDTSNLTYQLELQVEGIGL